MQVYKYNTLSIDSKELESTAEYFADMYHYDKQQGRRPSSPMRIFYEEFGENDNPESYLQLFSDYFYLCEKYKNDDDLIAKYESIDCY